MKKLLILFGVLAVLLLIIKRKDMSWRQSLTKLIYPLVMRFTEDKENGKTLSNTAHLQPGQSFYELHYLKNNGEKISFTQFTGKKVLLVNTASDCGYTGQYAELQKLYEEQEGSLVIVGFPANDFKEQEKGSDEEIAQFCKANYGVTFLLMKKSVVMKSKDQNEVFQWLTDKNKNGWTSQQPQWNFSKYLVNESGILINYFGPAVSPLSAKVLKALKNE